MVLLEGWKGERRRGEGRREGGRGPDGVVTDLVRAWIYPRGSKRSRPFSPRIACGRSGRSRSSAVCLLIVIESAPKHNDMLTRLLSWNHTSTRDELNGTEWSGRWCRPGLVLLWTHRSLFSPPFPLKPPCGRWKPDYATSMSRPGTTVEGINAGPMA